MPLYTYRCPVCDNIEEVNFSMEEVLRIKVYCPLCIVEDDEKTEMKKLISGNIRITFKGKGFYSTDKVEKIPRKVKEWQ